MVELEKEKLVKGQCRLGESKVWYLTKKGRDLMGVERKFIRPDRILNLNHLLEIGDAFLELHLAGGLEYFEPEPKQRFTAGTRELVYRPDAYYVRNGVHYCLEVQRSPKSTTAWAEKHAILEMLVSSGAWQKAFWHHGKMPKFVLPNILILSPRQEVDTIQAGSNLPLKIIRSLHELIA